MHQIRLLWMDILNITASICVILLHCNHHVKYLYEGKIDFTYLWGMIVYHFAYYLMKQIPIIKKNCTISSLR